MNEENLKPAKVGEVRNPNGRGKGSKNFKTILKHYLQAKIKMDKSSPFVNEGQEITAKDALMLKLITMGMKGNLSAIDKIVTRLDGMPEQNVNVKSTASNLNIDYTNLTEDEAKELFKKKQQDIKNG